MINIFFVSIIKLDYWFRNLILKTLEVIFFSNKEIFESKKILIFRTGSLGDSICALPAINIVRKNFPDAEIDIVTNSGADNLVSFSNLIRYPLINDIIDYNGMPKRKLTDILKEKKYDLLIEFPQDQQTLIRQVRNIFWVKMLGIRKAFGWQVAATRLFPALQDRYIVFKNERDRLVDILFTKGFSIYDYEYPLRINEDVSAKVKKLLEENNICEKEKNAVLVIGAKRVQNRWSPEYFNEVKDYLLNKGFNVLLIGNDEDTLLAEKLSGKNVFNFCGKLSPVESALLIKNCRFTISNDTGPMHLSYAAGTPVIAIFSSRDYKRKWYPPLDKNFVLRNESVFCRECFDNPCNGEKCHSKIYPAEVIKLVSRL